jgi:SlyX protein
MTVDIDTLALQITQLQTQLAFQEDAIGSLDKALAAQQQELLLVRRQLEILHERQRDSYGNTHGNAHDDAGSPPADDKPPHY